MTRAPDACVMTIFGASGDLTRRKLIPALCNLAQTKLLPTNFAIVGFASRPMTTEAFRRQLTGDVKAFATAPVDPKLWEWLLERIYYVQGDLADPAAFQRLRQQIDEVDQKHATRGNRFFYLAVAPAFFAGIVRELSRVCLTHEQNGRWSRVLIEKPFGSDLRTACELNRDIRTILDEKQIYRIDHYLGKETVQNVMVFRFANTFAEPIWNRNFIDHVQITATEAIGVEHRGRYYETSGALRDMIPNHLFQLLTLTAMEPPISFDPDAVRDKQAEILHAIRPCPPDRVLTDMVRGQYGPGLNGHGEMPAYRDEADVAPDSNTETFVALKLDIDNWRWAGVPFYLRTGKRIAKRVTEIVVQFRRAPFRLFRNTTVQELHDNRLVLHIQPDEGISLQFGAKLPGALMDIGMVNMDFDYARDFGGGQSTGYERLIHDCITGDATLFQRADMVEAGWSVIQPLIDVWKSLPARNFPNYAAGSWGPSQADELLSRDGRQWRQLGSCDRQ